MREELLKGLSEEQIAKVKACKNQEEILALAKAEGIELDDEQLAAVSGGFCSTASFVCPKCGSSDVSYYTQTSPMRKAWICTCNNCGNHWED